MKVKTAKMKAWKAFSLFIRTRDCILTTGDPETGKCFTCDAIYNIKLLQAGHFIPGRHNANLFSDKGVNAQCQRCNKWLYGNQYEYGIRLEKMYGIQVVKDLLKKNKEYKKFTVDDLLEKEELYIGKLKMLLEEL